MIDIFLFGARWERAELPCAWKHGGVVRRDYLMNDETKAKMQYAIILIL
jgi:hypothetical protein